MKMKLPSAEKIMQDCVWSVLVDLKLELSKKGKNDVQYHFWLDESTREGEDKISVMKKLVSGGCIKILDDGEAYLDVYNISNDEDQYKNGFLFYRLEIQDKFFRLYDEYAAVYAAEERLVKGINVSIKQRTIKALNSLGLVGKQKTLLTALSGGKLIPMSDLIEKTETKRFSSLARDVNAKIKKFSLEIVCAKKKTFRKESLYQLISH